MLRILIAGVTGLRQTIIVGEITMLEDGMQRKSRQSVAFYRWEDVTRYEPYRLDFALFFKNGEKIRFPVETKDSEEVKSFILGSRANWNF